VGGRTPKHPRRLRTWTVPLQHSVTRHSDRRQWRGHQNECRTTSGILLTPGVTTIRRWPLLRRLNNRFRLHRESPAKNSCGLVAVFKPILTNKRCTGCKYVITHSYRLSFCGQPLWPALRYGTGYQTVWEIRLSAETPSGVHWRRFYFQLTRVHSALELTGRCAIQIDLLTYLLLMHMTHTVSLI